MAAFEQPAQHAWSEEFFGWTVSACFRPLQALMAAPGLLFLFTMTVMLFRPADHRFHSYDRFAFVLLVLVVLLRSWTMQIPIRVAGPVTWPLFALLALALYDAASQPYDPETWGVLAAKWLVPLGLYLIAGQIFGEAHSRLQFEVFALLVLGYLCVIAILFMVGARGFIFPRYILDESLGIHADRARGPFLQAVANGVALNMLGLIALDSFRRHRLPKVPAVLLLAALPLAIVATKTRAVWLSFAGSVLWLMFFSPSRCLRRTCLCLVLGAGLGLIATLGLGDSQRSLQARLEESSPVAFRMAIYQAGWEMFLQKPLAGWGSLAMQSELSSRISDFHQEQFYFHNTYLEILVQFGLVGLALYLWLIVDLFRLGRKRPGIRSRAGAFPDAQFRSLWPLLLVVYLMNASFVVMNYQFVNGILFTLAGMLVAQNRRDHEEVNALAS
ncbi:MAG: O-antigen ligase family protein [Terriglobales bacterium]